MTDLEGGAAEFADLARNLRLVGADDLRAELYKAINDATQPVAAEIRNVERIKPYMPDRYAEILAEDLAIQTQKLTGVATAGLKMRARGRRRSRHVSRLNQGILTHPVFGTAAQELKASGHGRGWTWVTQEISPRWFDDAATAVTPEVRQQIEQAVQRIKEHIYGR